MSGPTPTRITDAVADDGIRVLIVDDDFMVARVHTGFVEKVEGFEVVGVAHTAADALTQVSEHRPDLVLLDMYLPDRFGLDVLGELRRAGSDCDVIVITAARELDAVRGAIQRGVVDYVLKPFGFQDLRERLERYAAQRQLLRGADEVDGQAEIDRVLARAGSGSTVLPKGLSPETVAVVADALRTADGTLSATEAAEAVGISRVSARRYLEYFVSTGRAEVSLRYGTTGRPERRYRRA
ncbi:response regulator [Pedococcus sp. NPDC057267]|uniref:response regulator n=1 Tax=Pedococcus sp. NPDC057267 TaxID=3346077 RepID=UPI00362E2B25